MLHTQRTADLKAFDSNLRAIIGARELGKTTALVSNLCRNASEPQSVGVSSKDDTHIRLGRNRAPCPLFRRARSVLI